MSCFIFHKWGKWEKPEVMYYRETFFNGQSTEPITVETQKRVCDNCGKVKIRKV